MGKVFLLNFGYGLQMLIGDLVDCFGFNFVVEVLFDYMIVNNWVIGIQGQFLFGSIVNEDVLVSLCIVIGDIIGNDCELVDIQLW